MKCFDLSILATQGKYCCTCNVWIVDVACDQCTQRFGILARTAASTVVTEELDAINILEEAGAVRRFAFSWCRCVDGLNLSLLVKVDEILYIVFILVGFT